MIALAGVFAVAMALQVPPPDAPEKEARALHREERAILDREAARLTALADRLAKRGENDAAAEVRRDLPLPARADGASRFVPLPEIVPARGKGLANIPAGTPAPASWKAEHETIRAEAGSEFFKLANKAGTSPLPPCHYALADACLRRVLDRQPDHAEARKLLGFVPYNGGWATPFAAAKTRDGMTLHPTFGWVKSSWVAHLENGELPSRRGREVWVPAAEADAERADFANAWRISTEHFQIRTNVPLSEAIVFGRHLEVFTQLFQSLMADVIAENLPLAHRFKGEPVQSGKHSVSYFATKGEFVSHLRPQEPEIEQSLGLYLPSPRGKQRGHAHFYRDDGGEIAVTATLYHEVSHQLLFESGIARPDDFEQNAGNYWVFEGLGTYFETLTLEPDGSVLIGGLVGPRLAEARTNLVRNGRMVPLKWFVGYNQDVFNRKPAIFLHYQQANALAAFLMQANGERYREDFLDYVRDAVRGRFRFNATRSLESRVGKPYAEIEAELLAYLKGDTSGQ